jgi:hypothetical protein
MAMRGTKPIARGVVERRLLRAHTDMEREVVFRPGNPVVAGDDGTHGAHGLVVYSRVIT